MEVDDPAQGRGRTQVDRGPDPEGQRALAWVHEEGDVIAQAARQLAAVLEMDGLADPTGLELGMAGNDGLAEVAVERSDLWMLITRESENLPEDQRHQVQQRFAALRDALAGHLTTARPPLSEPDLDLLTRAVLAALAAPAQFGQRLTGRRLATALAAISATICEIDVPHATGSATTAAHRNQFDASLSRQEEVLAVAARLFAERGYQNVSLADIGAEADMAGPSLYHHFASKSEILLGVLRRSIDWIELDRTRSIRDNDEPDIALHRLVESYVDMAMATPDLFRVFTKEAINLRGADQEFARRAPRQLVTHWTAMLRRAEPALSEGEAQTRVTACLSVINELAPARRHAQQHDHPERLASIAMAVLLGR